MNFSTVCKTSSVNFRQTFSYKYKETTQIKQKNGDPVSNKSTEKFKERKIFDEKKVNWWRSDQYFLEKITSKEENTNTKDSLNFSREKKFKTEL